MTVMAPDDAEQDTALTSGDVADLTGLSQATILRIKPEVLAYWLTPGSGDLRHRRYQRSVVEAWARETLGRELDCSPEAVARARAARRAKRAGG